MKKGLLLTLLLILLVFGALYYFLPRYTYYHVPLPSVAVSKEKKKEQVSKLKLKAATIKDFIRRKKLSREYCFLIDMSLPSGRKRFFVYDLEKDTVIHSGLVAHGSCNEDFLEEASYSNVVGGGCSSMGRYSIGNKYQGQFGTAYKLHGLDSTNSNAFQRFVVLHAYDCVPDYEIHPQPLCNSLGCPMLSYNFLSTLSALIDRSKRPILLWMFE